MRRSPTTRVRALAIPRPAQAIATQWIVAAAAVGILLTALLSK